jgi:hypothetical protein
MTFNDSFGELNLGSEQKIRIAADHAGNLWAISRSGDPSRDFTDRHYEHLPKDLRATLTKHDFWFKCRNAAWRLQGR